jgi:lipid A disaccharide synthetase
MPPTIFISAGEASGEHYGALLIAALQQRMAAAGQTASFFGMGGPRMAAEGLQCVVRSEDMAVMGLTEVVRHLPRIWREFRRLKQAIRQRPPSVAVLIDFPEIHFRLAKEFHRLGVPVVYFVSPQLWAWKQKRIRLVRKYIDRMLVIFPFEEPFYRGQGVAAEFVGHPLAELAAPTVSREQFAAANGLDPAKTWIGLLPGSRPKEIRDILPEMLRAAREMAALPAERITDAPDVLKGQDSGEKNTGFVDPAQRICIALSHPGDKNKDVARVGHPDSVAIQKRRINREEGAEVGVKGAGFSVKGTGFSVKGTGFSVKGTGFSVKGTGFSVKGTGFSPYINSANKTGALAPEGTPFEFLIPLAPTLNEAQRAEVRQIVAAHGAGLPLRLIDEARSVLFHARASVVASGTATVEAALIGNPFVVVYHVSPLTFAIAKRVVKLPCVAMANLIAGKQVVPELLQGDFTAAKIVQQIKPLLADAPARQSMMEELARIRGLLSTRPTGGAIDRVAEVTLEVMRRDG